ncbi:redoxin domain-containing protein [Actinomadura sp. LD22]|uniref:Redoxin domain-containing protein n=1 Tax=Actinomadura physcomitrii TaxID=2650748 RepID=A0A6I4MT45_9ACTN|nr:SCO family protein [Actinomadura physcomitrii]MWA05859.1 redoxin domain-containing protein [Actinomadura physcomitrii]
MRAFSRASFRSSRPTTVGFAGALAAVCLTVSACGGSAAGNATATTATASPSGGTAVRLDRPLTKPELTLTDDHGKPFDLVKRTAGKPTLMYFGYTHCPDVCPTTMADLANAVKQLPEADQKRLQVIFVTTDPARDTPKRLHQWLAAFDRRFTGLSGDFDAVQKAARSVGVSVDEPVKNADGSYTVTHGAEVLAFSPADDKVHIIYTSGTTTQRYAADLPALIRGQV